MDKSCLICKHSILHPEEPDYSEVTPGSPSYWSCFKNQWERDPLELDKKGFIKLIKQAETCKYFENYEE